MNDAPVVIDRLGLTQRPRRLRRSAALRRMSREHDLRTSDLIYPLFVSRRDQQPVEIPSMPGQFRWPLSAVRQQVERLAELDIPAVLLFGIPAEKDAVGSENFAHDGVVQQAIRAIKNAVPEMVVITDVCCCEYTIDGHCGMVNDPARPAYNPRLPTGYLLNDESLEMVNRVAVSHAQCGADMVAPSGMLDGVVASIRGALDADGLQHVAILSYSVKYASAFYGPFRDAADGAPQFGDRTSHQMDPRNIREAIREARLDVAQGCDVLMVKPALPYLDVIRALRQSLANMVLAAYNTSGEYAMVKAAAARGWLDERRVVEEMLLGIKRAGADWIITYFAKEAAQWLRQQ